MTKKEPAIPIEYVKSLFDEDEHEEMELYWYFVSDKGRGTSKLLNQKTLTIKDTDQTYRIINHWSSEGLIDDDREQDSKQWRKMSIIDIAWIRIIVEMRKFGLPLDKIKYAKKQLWFSPDYTKGKCPFFEVAVWRTVCLKRETFILVFPDGNAYPISKESLDARNRCSVIDSYISINLNRVVQDIFKDRNFDFYPKTTGFTLTEEELNLINDVRKGNFESIRIRLKGGEIEMIEATEKIDAQKRIVEILSDADFQDIEVKKKDGKIVSIRRTVKKKPASKATGRTRASSTEPLRPSDKPKSNAVHSNAHG
jgi:hypothetical protein